MISDRSRLSPWWVGYALLFPTRKIFNNPYRLLKPYVKSDMAVLDYGCAMGYFSIPMAKMVAPEGMVFCADIQPKMLSKLRERAIKNGVSENISLLEVGGNYKPEKLKDKIDFALLFAVVHEVSDKHELFTHLYSMIKSGGILLIAEPKGHVKSGEFIFSLSLAQKAGFKILSHEPFNKELKAVLIK